VTAPLARPRVSVVVPAHNEAEALPLVIPRVLRALGEAPCEIVIVDDGSRDATWAAIETLRREIPCVRGVRLSRNFGHQAALLAGLATARGEAVIMLDADGQHPPELIPELLREWSAGAEVVQAMRVENRHTSFARRRTSDAYYRFLRRISGLPLEAGTADFRLLSRHAVDTILAIPGPTPLFRALLPWLGLRTAHVAFSADERVAGATSYSWARMLELSLEGVLGYSALPLRLVGLSGVVIAGIALLYLVYVLAVRLLGGPFVAGWASVAGLVALLGGIQLVVLGALGEYLARVFIATLGRPRYVVAERLDG
jgi:dolichol-phosphate mannosyltransferase